MPHKNSSDPNLIQRPTLSWGFPPGRWTIPNELYDSYIKFPTTRKNLNTPSRIQTRNVPLTTSMKPLSMQGRLLFAFFPPGRFKHCLRKMFTRTWRNSLVGGIEVGSSRTRAHITRTWKQTNTHIKSKHIHTHTPARTHTHTHQTHTQNIIHTHIASAIEIFSSEHSPWNTEIAKYVKTLSCHDCVQYGHDFRSGSFTWLSTYLNLTSTNALVDCNLRRDLFKPQWSITLGKSIVRGRSSLTIFLPSLSPPSFLTPLRAHPHGWPFYAQGERRALFIEDFWRKVQFCTHA